MSLNSNQMLPAKTRNMRQMREVLDVEDIILNEIEKIIDEMYESASVLHEELINEKWLEEHLGKLIGGKVEVSKRDMQLYVDAFLCVGKLSKQEEEKVIAFFEKWLPAHLAYGVTYDGSLETGNNFAILWQDDEMITIRQVEL